MNEEQFDQCQEKAVESNEMKNLEIEADRYQQDLAKKPNSARLWSRLGAVLQKQEKLEAAEKAYRQALKIKSSSPLWLCSALVDVLEAQGKISEAITASEYVHEVYPEQSQEFYLKHQQLLQKQDFDLYEIKEQLEEQVLLEKKVVLNCQLLAIINEELNQEESAIQYYQKILELQPNSYQNHLATGHFLIKLGRIDAAEQEFATAKIIEQSLKDQREIQKKTTKIFQSLLNNSEFERALDLWLKVIQDRQQSKLNKKFEELCSSYEKNMGYALYEYYKKYGVEKIHALLDINLDLVIFYVSKASSIVKKEKFLSFARNLYKNGYRSEKLIGLFVSIQCKKNNFDKCLKILSKEFGKDRKKIVDVNNLLPACQVLLKRGYVKETLQLLDSFLDYQTGNIEEKIFFKYLVQSCDLQSNLEIREELITDLERLFDLDTDYFKSLTLRCATTTYQKGAGQLLEVIEKIDDQLRSRQNLDNSCLQGVMKELKLSTLEFQSYFRDIPIPSYKKMEDIKVALCISGQLRGYEKAFQSWKKHILEPLQPDIFVNTWNDVGFKEPIVSHANRIISGQFLQVYRKVILDNYSNSSKDSYLSFKENYPTFNGLLESKNQYCNFQQLAQFYKTQNIVIDNAEDDFFRAMENQTKMLYKISACDEMKDIIDRQYDLVIRIRPDLEIKDFSEDWSSIYERCYEQNAVIVDGIKMIRGASKLGTGDVFAIGTKKSLNWYCSLNKVVDFYANNKLLNMSKYVPHGTLFWHLWYGGLKVYSINMGFDFVTATLTAKELYSAFSKDINLDTAKDYEKEMIRALENDMKFNKE